MNVKKCLTKFSNPTCCLLSGIKSIVTTCKFGAALCIDLENSNIY